MKVGQKNIKVYTIALKKYEFLILAFFFKNYNIEL